MDEHNVLVKMPYVEARKVMVDLSHAVGFLCNLPELHNLEDARKEIFEELITELENNMDKLMQRMAEGIDESYEA